MAKAVAEGAHSLTIGCIGNQWILKNSESFILVYDELYLKHVILLIG